MDTVEGELRAEFCRRRNGGSQAHTLARDREGTITGWLLIFRDITEEIELARLRDDMTHMLVHDLRSPLTVLMGSLDFMESAFASSILIYHIIAYFPEYFNIILQAEGAVLINKNI